MAVISQIIVLLPSFQRHLKALGEIYLLLYEYFDAASMNFAEIDNLFHLCCNRMALDLIMSQECLPFRDYLFFFLHSCAI